MILMTVVSYLGSGDYSNKWVLLIEVAISLFITVATLQVSFDLNSNGDRKDYLKRYISLSLVSGVRVVVFSLIVEIPIAIIMNFLVKTFGDDQFTQEILNLFLMAFIGIAYYFIFTNSFRRIYPKNI